MLLLFGPLHSQIYSRVLPPLGKTFLFRLLVLDVRADHLTETFGRECTSRSLLNKFRPNNYSVRRIFSCQFQTGVEVLVEMVGRQRSDRTEGLNDRVPFVMPIRPRTTTLKSNRHVGRASRANLQSVCVDSWRPNAANITFPPGSGRFPRCPCPSQAIRSHASSAPPAVRRLAFAADSPLARRHLVLRSATRTLSTVALRSLDPFRPPTFACTSPLERRPYCESCMRAAPFECAGAGAGLGMWSWGARCKRSGAEGGHEVGRGLVAERRSFAPRIGRERSAGATAARAVLEYEAQAADGGRTHFGDAGPRRWPHAVRDELAGCR